MFQNRDIIQNVCLILGEKIFLDFLKITVDKKDLPWYLGIVPMRYRSVHRTMTNTHKSIRPMYHGFDTNQQEQVYRIVNAIRPTGIYDVIQLKPYLIVQGCNTVRKSTTL